MCSHAACFAGGCGKRAADWRRFSARICRFRAGAQSFQAGAAPHLPAGILSPYSDGERGAAIAGFASTISQNANEFNGAAPCLTRLQPA
ncbi:hypothetical protein CK224_18940 [Mesorhizobium sp. WSM3862]|nr:hypothetical protein CK224_18940 [Mesorhizobium sp. WSM3862]